MNLFRPGTDHQLTRTEIIEGLRGGDPSCVKAAIAVLEEYPLAQWPAESVRIMSRDLRDRKGFRELMLDDVELWMKIEGVIAGRLAEACVYRNPLPEPRAAETFDLDFDAPVAPVIPDLDF